MKAFDDDLSILSPYCRIKSYQGGLLRLFGRQTVICLQSRPQSEFVALPLPLDTRGPSAI